MGKVQGLSTVVVLALISCTLMSVEAQRRDGRTARGRENQERNTGRQVIGEERNSQRNGVNLGLRNTVSWTAILF